MCFSASASFGASALLLGIGIFTLKNTERKDQKFLASIPLILSFQQFLEGIVWLSILNSNFEQWKMPSIYGFLIIAQILWPIFIPYSILVLEKVKSRKTIIFYLWMMGIIQGIYFGIGLIYFPVSASISNSHIAYQMDFPAANNWYGGVLYMFATAISPLFSSIKKIKWIGLIVILTYLISRIFFAYYVISIWCYFAAIISLIILGVIMDFKKRLAKQARR